MKKFSTLFMFAFIVTVQLAFADFPIRKSTNWDGASVIAYNSTDHQYLVAWVEAIPVLGGYLTQVKGQLLAENGSMVGTVFTIFANGTLPSISYNPKTNEYFVVACQPELFGQRVSNTGNLIGNRVQLTTKSATPRILYNSLAENYLLTGSMSVEIPPLSGNFFNQIFTLKIGSDGQPIGAIQFFEGVYSDEFSIAYAPISSAETPTGRYLLVFPGGQPIMLDSEGNPLSTITDHYGVKHIGIPFTFGNANGGIFHVDVAYGFNGGNGAFLVVWGDNNNHFSNQEWTGIWGNFVDAYKLDYTVDYEIQNTTFPISAIYAHWAYPTDDFAGSWKPKVTYNFPGQKFMVTWRETPSNDALNDTKVNHIRADKVWKAITFNPNVVISTATGKENPKNPAIAASTINPNALIVWEDARDSTASKMDIYGNLYSIPAAPTITVVQPNGGESWQAGSQQEIKWISKNFTDPVMIEYSTNGGSSYTSIANSTGNDGSYNWTVPFQYSKFCLVRIKDASDSDPVDLSDAVFTISGHMKTVANTNDSGPGSFRQAILDANISSGADTIVFNVPGTGIHTIQPLSALPIITDPIFIDGFSQPGSSPNTNSISQWCNAHLTIELDGSKAGTNTQGLFLRTGSSTIRGMVINNFDNGIYISDISAVLKGGNIIEGNFIGLGADGMNKKPNQSGISCATSSGNLIGGTKPSSRNVISGNTIEGIGLAFSYEGNTVQGNFIGTDVTGFNSLGNGDGINAANNGNKNTIGGTLTEQRNIISGNNRSGITFNHAGDSKIVGNFIGTDISGMKSLPNTLCGIYLKSSDGNRIGGTVAEAGNIISGNTGDGIYLESSHYNGIEGNVIGLQFDGVSPLGNGKSGITLSRGDNSDATCFSNRIVGNRMNFNQSLGLNLVSEIESCWSVTPNDPNDNDAGPNNLQNFPVLTKAETGDAIFVSGVLNSRPNTKYRIDYYANSKPHRSFNGEGEKPIGFTEVTTDNNGDVRFSSSIGVKIPPSYFITATATDPDGNTSEFSANIPLVPNTPIGLNIQTVMGELFKLIFDNVTAAGYTRATTYLGGPSVPGNLIPLPIGAPFYYSISTTAAYAGNITVAIQYNDTSFTADQEAKLRLHIYESEHWKDITSLLDTTNNTISGITSHLSDFIIAIPSARPLNILVTNTQDSGVGSLRNALQLAIENSGPDTVLFNIPMSDSGFNPLLGNWTIKPATVLNIPDKTVVDGRVFTSENLSAPTIEIDGTWLRRAGGVALWLYKGAEIHGLVVNNCQYGVWVADSGAKVEDCYIGTDPSGNYAKSNTMDGILVANGAREVILQRNLISGNGGCGIRMFGARTTKNIIRGNFIGTTVFGNKALPNSDDGIQLHAGAFENIIEQNLISGNLWHGVHLLDSATNYNTVRGNFIGADISGLMPIPNGLSGVALMNGPKYNVIGPDNNIAFNTQYGVFVDGSDSFTSTIGNTITANRIIANGVKGIGNFRGGNNELPPPIIQSIAADRVKGLASASQQLEFFLSETEQGDLFIGSVTSDSSGSFRFQLPSQLPTLPNLLATATDAIGNTSEFSHLFKITAVAEPNSDIPKEFVLYQNYPNPFNPVTTLSFSMPTTELVRLKVYNISGDEVMTLVNEKKPAGNYKVMFDAARLPTGVYFYKLETNSYTSVKKMILIK